MPTATVCSKRPPEIGVVAPLGAGRAAELRGVRAFEDEPGRHGAQSVVMDLGDEVLQEALELLHRAIGRGQERSGVEGARLHPLDVIELRDEVAAEALDPALDLNGVARLEAKADAVGLAKDAGGERAAAVAKLEREVGRAVLGGQAVLAHARERARKALPGPQVGNLRRVAGRGSALERLRCSPVDCRTRRGRPGHTGRRIAGSLAGWIT